MPVARLVDRSPEVAPERLISDLVPPPLFADVGFATYRPDPSEPTQEAALRAVTDFAGTITGAAGTDRSRRFRKRGRASGQPAPAGLYLDGGFGVGKTHLLASLWHEAPGPKAYGTFVELTHLVGALGFHRAIEALCGLNLLCIDEFELDDPGDTVLISTLLGRLVDSGVRLAATSNTLPDRLGEGRFAAEDFLREIQALSSQFAVVRVDGPDFRHRGLEPPPPPWPDDQLRAAAERAEASVTCDDFGALCAHLEQLHPSRYGPLLDGVDAAYLSGVRPVAHQAVALRLVVLVDRLYDRQIPVVASGESLDLLFGADMLAGGYRKKYLRALSRVMDLARRGGAGAPAVPGSTFGSADSTGGSDSAVPARGAPGPPVGG